eukprot:270182_1
MGNSLKQHESGNNNYTESNSQNETTEQKEVINVLSRLRLSDQFKENGINLICEVFQNIINDTSNIKYHRINADKLFKKLDHTIFIDLLTVSGFEKSSNDKRLIFNPTQLDTLKKMHEILLKYKSDLSENYSLQNNDQNTSIFSKIYKKLNPVIDEEESSDEEVNNLDKLMEMGFSNQHCVAVLDKFKYDEFDTVVEYLKGYTELEVELNICNGIYGNVLDCAHLKNLTKILNTYNNNNCQIVYDIIANYKVVNIFNHLLIHHDTEVEFETIHKQLNYCNLQNCKIFKRNYRDRSVIKDFDITKLYETSELKLIVLYQILDAIHCYYCHSYDTGHKISPKHKDTINANDSDSYFHRVRNIILSTSQTTQFYTSDKFNQLQMDFEEIKETEQIQGSYNFGKEFVYSGKKSDGKIFVIDQGRKLIVMKKWRNFKEELTNNAVCTIEIQQFNNEYRKANIKFNSHHRKKTCTKLLKNEILALMCYTNFDNLQSQLSKTYYKNFQNHGEFWNFAYLLKKSMSQCIEFEYSLQNNKDPKILKLYHGIDKKLSFPAYLECNIWSPLSTTSSVEVAINFSNNNQGFIIEFNINTKYVGYNNTRYLSVNWLSDFHAENEYLFVQSGLKLQINDIIEPSTDIHYKPLLKAMLILQRLTRVDKWDFDVPESIQKLVTKIIQHRLCRNDAKVNLNKPYPNFESLNKYGNEMLRTFHSNMDKVDYIEFSYPHIKEKHEYLARSLFHDNMEWIKMDVISALFPNKKSGVIIFGIKLCSALFEDILENYSNCNFDYIRLININDKGELSAKQAYAKYKKKFREFKIDLSVDEIKGKFLLIEWSLWQKNRILLAEEKGIDLGLEDMSFWEYALTLFENEIKSVESFDDFNLKNWEEIGEKIGQKMIDSIPYEMRRNIAWFSIGVIIVFVCVASYTIYKLLF